MACIDHIPLLGRPRAECQLLEPAGIPYPHTQSLMIGCEVDTLPKKANQLAYQHPMVSVAWLT